MYEFSVPMPLELKYIDDIIAINNNFSNSKITSFYFALPIQASDRSSFEQIRTENEIPNFEFVMPLIKYAKKNKFEFIYLLNSVAGFSNIQEVHEEQKKALDILMDKLRATGSNKVRVTNFQVVSYLKKYHPDFQIYMSTSCEYTQIAQFKNMMKLFPFIKEFIPSYEINKDFHLLKNLRKEFPDTEIELIADEGCIMGCPFRKEHALTQRADLHQKKLFPDENEKFEHFFISKKCYDLTTSLQQYIEYLCLSRIIFPWEIDYYGDMGYRHYKLVGRTVPTNKMLLNYYYNYFNGIKNPHSIDNIPIRFFYFRYRYSRNLPVELLVKDIKKHLPDIRYFVKNGKDCHYKCGSECKYCYNKAQQIIKHINK